MKAYNWDLDGIIKHLETYESTRQKAQLMFEDVQLVLTELGFLHSGRYRKDPNVDVTRERDLLDDLWTHLKGDFYGDVSMTNLKSFL